MKNNPLTRTDIGRFEINGTGTERAIPVQRPFDIRSTSVQHPFSVRSFSVFSKRASVERAVYGKFFLTHTVHVHTTGVGHNGCHSLTHFVMIICLMYCHTVVLPDGQIVAEYISEFSCTEDNSEGNIELDGTGCNCRGCSSTFAT